MKSVAIENQKNMITRSWDQTNDLMCTGHWTGAVLNWNFTPVFNRSGDSISNIFLIHGILKFKVDFVCGLKFRLQTSTRFSNLGRFRFVLQSTEIIGEQIRWNIPYKHYEVWMIRVMLAKRRRFQSNSGNNKENLQIQNLLHNSCFWSYTVQ